MARAVAAFIRGVETRASLYLSAGMPCSRRALTALVSPSEARHTSSLPSSACVREGRGVWRGPVHGHERVRAWLLESAAYPVSPGVALVVWPLRGHADRARGAHACMLASGGTRLSPSLVRTPPPPRPTQHTRAHIVWLWCVRGRASCAQGCDTWNMLLCCVPQHIPHVRARQLVGPRSIPRPCLMPRELGNWRAS